MAGIQCFCPFLLVPGKPRARDENVEEQRYRRRERVSRKDVVNLVK